MYIQTVQCMSRETFLQSSNLSKVTRKYFARVFALRRLAWIIFKYIYKLFMWFQADPSKQQSATVSLRSAFTMLVSYLFSLPYNVGQTEIS
jgi:hypothetical protein